MVANTFSIPHSGRYDNLNDGACPAHNTRQSELDDFNELVLAHQDAVYRQAYWILGEEEAAEDVAQEAFIRAYQHMHQFNGGPFLPWILRITTNYCLDQLRKLKIRKTVALEELNEYDEAIEDPAWLKDPGEPIETSLERAEVSAKIMHSINRLPDAYRAAVILVDLQELDYQEAAAAIGIPIGTFKSRLSRARAQLQKQLAQEYLLCAN